MKKPEIIKAGSVRVKIYETVYGWVISYYDQNGKRKQPRFSTYQEALKAANDKAKAIAQGHASATIDPKDKAIFRTISDMVDGDHALLLQAVSEFVDRQGDPVEDKKLRIVCDEMIEDRRQHNSESYVKSLTLHFNHLCRDFGGAWMSSLTGPKVQKWVSARKSAHRTKKNILTSIRTLVVFALSRGYLREDPLKAVKLPKVKKSGRIEIFTPQEFSALISDAPEPLLAYILIGAFAGIRTAEIQRLDWSDIGSKSITVDADKAKTAARRIVPISDNLLQWLEPIRKKSGPIVRHRNLAAEISKWMLGNRNLKWYRNGLRHSYVSYRLEILQDAGKVAMECGNSPQMIFNDYRELVTPEAAKEWFSITPEGKCLQMPSQVLA